MTHIIGDELSWGAAELERHRALWSTALDDGDRERLWSGEGGEPEVPAGLRSFVEHAFRTVGLAHIAALTDPALGEEEAAERLLGFVRALLMDGSDTFLPQNDAGDPTRILRDEGGDGADGLGFHSDTCDVLVLLCLQPAVRGGGETRLASARRVRDVLAAEDPDALAVLQEDWTFDRTGRAGPRLIVGPILFTQPDGTVGGYYQPRTVRTSPERGAPPLSPRQWRALEVLDGVLYRPETYYGLRLAAGDLLLILNSRILHGRSPYQDVPGPDSRRVMRAWVQKGAR